MTLSKLTNRTDFAWQSGGNFGQIARKPIDKIVLHHNAGTGSGVVPNCWVNRQASAHYQIENGIIIGCLDEDVSGWHCGAAGQDNNSHTIGIEHQNSTGAPNWLVSDQNQEKSAQLVAEICKRRGIPIDRNHIVRHREMPGCQTACSGGLNIDWIVNRAKQIAGQSDSGASASQPPQAITNKGEITMYLINCKDNNRWYLSTGSEIKYIKTLRVLGFYQKTLGLPTDVMFQGELDQEFGKAATDPNRDVSKG